MSTCSNCYNGCAETISDQCVKYTGIDVPALGISTGDSLLSVENAITNFLVPAINGTGIKPIIDPNIICNIVKSYLPPCTTCVGFTLNEVLTAIVKTVCDLKDQIDDIDATLATLNANYTIGCLSGVTASSDTHAIVQATINNLCSLNTAFSNLVSQLNTINVTSLNIDDYITIYLDSQPSVNSASAKMVPYCPIAYYGALSGYPSASDGLSLTGPGVGYWANVYLCNGLNGTPDLRGRAIVGTTVMGNNAFPPQTDPCGSCTDCANPTYELETVAGANCVTLFINEIPNHTHLNTASSTAIDTGHTHGNTTGALIRSDGLPIYGSGYDNGGTTTVGFANIQVTTTITNAFAGGGDAHPNIQPVIALHYIMYIP
jgi:microcystin-dependent protein